MTLKQSIKFRVFVIAALASLSSLSYAQDTSSNYISFSGGIPDQDDTAFSIAAGTIDTEYNSDISVGLAYGRNYDSFRGELEFILEEGDAETHTLNNGPDLAGSVGELSMNAVMANVVFDFDNASDFTPYLGAGLGIAQVNVENFGVDAIPEVADDSDNVFAYQLIGGVSYAATDSIDVFFEYRFFAADGAEITTTPAAGSVNTEIDYQSNLAKLGVRFKW